MYRLLVFALNWAVGDLRKDCNESTIWRLLNFVGSFPAKLEFDWDSGRMYLVLLQLLKMIDSQRWEIIIAATAVEALKEAQHCLDMVPVLDIWCRCWIYGAGASAAEPASGLLKIRCHYFFIFQFCLSWTRHHVSVRSCPVSLENSNKLLPQWQA